MEILLLKYISLFLGDLGFTVIVDISCVICWLQPAPSFLSVGTRSDNGKIMVVR